MTKIIAVFVVFLTFALPVSAANYIERDTINPALLTPPLLVNSPAWKADIATVLKTQRGANAEQKAAAAGEEELHGTDLTQVIDPTWNAETKPALFTLLNNIEDDCAKIVGASKKYWNTKRPFMQDDSIKNLTGTPKTSGAYPSGHTACSRVLAEVLGEIKPTAREALRARAEQVAWHRMVAGVHYPHDLAGGRQLALLIMGALQTNDDYHDDLAAARAEIGG